MTYYRKIDGLRCVAISLVLVEHFLVIGQYMSAGYYGVDLFFVISGFLITSILIRPNDHSFLVNYRNFIGRRTLRIFPIYYLTILVLWLAGLPVIREKLVCFLTYTFNYAWIIFNLPQGPVTHFWSLSVEEQFYLFWPFVVLSLRSKPKYLLLVTISIIVFGYAQSIFSVVPALTPFNNTGLLTRMAALGLGALGALLVSEKWLAQKTFTSRIIEYTVFLALIISLLLNYNGKIMVLGLCSFFFVVKATTGEFHFRAINNFLQHRQVVKIGTLAYGIYIFHLPLMYYGKTYCFDPIWNHIDFSVLGPFQKIRYHSWIIKFPLFSLASIFLAALSFKYIETPILKLKDRYFRY